MEKVETERSEESMEIRKKLKEGKGSKWAKRCLKEIEKRNETGEGKSRWEKEKDIYV